MSQSTQSYAAQMLNDNAALRTKVEHSEEFAALRDQRPTIEVDGETLYIVEGDEVKDEDQLAIYALERETLQQARELGLVDVVQERGLLGMRENGQIVRWAPGTALTYCVLRSTFATQQNYQMAVENMRRATKDWEATCGIKFQHLANLDQSTTITPQGVLFTVRQLDAGGRFIAASFFPNDPVQRRKILIDNSYFRPSRFDKVGVLRHELGHVLGFRHEHIRSGAPPICPDEETVGTIELTRYDPQSVMHYFCGGVGNPALGITELDRIGAQRVYGAPLADSRLIEATGGTVSPDGEQDRQLVEELAAIERSLEEVGSDGAAALDVGQACRQYNQIKPQIGSVLGLVEMVPIPQVRQIAGIVRFLMGVADTACALDDRGFTDGDAERKTSQSRLRQPAPRR